MSPGSSRKRAAAAVAAMRGQGLLPVAPSCVPTAGRYSDHCLVPAHYREARDGSDERHVRVATALDACGNEAHVQDRLSSENLREPARMSVREVEHHEHRRREVRRQRREHARERVDAPRRGDEADAELGGPLASVLGSQRSHCRTRPSSRPKGAREPAYDASRLAEATTRLTQPTITSNGFLRTQEGPLTRSRRAYEGLEDRVA